MNIIFKHLSAPCGEKAMAAITRLLQSQGLTLDPNCQHFVLALDQGCVVGCGAVAGAVLKCIALDPAYQGAGISLKLLTELIFLAKSLGESDLFLYTQPKNEALFNGAGFWTIARAGERALLMENSPSRLARYCRQLALQRQPGQKIGSIVMNANPFTLGHRWLVEQAARQCDWLHLFVVKEDAAYFSYRDRWQMIEKGIAGIAGVTLHPGSAYLISRATFPAYFIKDQAGVVESHCQIDLQLFREHLAPALDITHRFVGTEPRCRLTRDYNRQMKAVLPGASSVAAPIQVVELARLARRGEAISASQVRQLFFNGAWSELAQIVPLSTLAFLKAVAERTSEQV